MSTLSVKNFEKFQHYKDRNPPWIKLYNELLDDYEFARLQDASKMHLIAIWLLASRSGNKIPNDPVWIGRRINATERVKLEPLIESGFLLINQELPIVGQDASKMLATCLPRDRDRDRDREETEGEKDIYAPSFDDFWETFPKRNGTNSRADSSKKFSIVIKAGLDPLVLITAAAKYAAHCDSEGITGTKFVQQATTWLNQKGWENEYVKRTNGHSSLEEKFRRVAERIDRRQSNDEGGTQDCVLVPFPGKSA